MVIRFPNTKTKAPRRRSQRRKVKILPIEHSDIASDLDAIYRLLNEIVLQLAWPDRNLNKQSKTIRKARDLIEIAIHEQNRLVREQRDTLKGVIRFPGQKPSKSKRCPE